MSRVASFQRLAAYCNALRVGTGGLLEPVPSRTSQFCVAEYSLARRFAAVSKDETLRLVKELRSQTGAPIGDVRAALKEAEYNLDTAFDVLRKKGAAAAAKKSVREALQVR